jgi:hypothetical protein
VSRVALGATQPMGTAGGGGGGLSPKENQWVWIAGQLSSTEFKAAVQLYRHTHIYILPRVLVTNNAGSGSDERIYLLLIHTTSNYT